MLPAKECATPQSDPPRARRGVLDTAMLVLDAYRSDDDGLSFTDLRRRTALPKATLHRVLGELTDKRLLDRDGTATAARYRLGRHLFELGLRASSERRLLEVAMPFLEDLYERTHETVHLGVRDGVEVVYLAKVGGHRQVGTPSRLGGRLPLHATAVGKALLAHADADVVDAALAAPLRRLASRTVTAPGILRRQLEAARRCGVTYEYEESRTGIACVGAPVLGRDGSTSAAISVAGPVTRFHPPSHAAAVRASAERLGGAMAAGAPACSS